MLKTTLNERIGTEMKMKIFYILPLMFIALLADSENGYSYTLPDDLDITEVYFNHNTSSSTNDAITIKENYSTTVSAPEYTLNDSSGFAYIINTQANIKATLERDDSGINSADIYVVCNSGTSIGSFPAYTRFTFTQNSVTYQINRSSGSVTKYVGIYDVVLRWVVVGVNGSPISPVVLGDTSHDYYTILASPKAPFDGSDQAGPWTRVLDYVCNWASLDTLDYQAASHVTEGIYNDLGDDGGSSGEIYYQRGDPAYSDFNGNTNNFFLQWFFNDIDYTGKDNVDCLDMANLVQTFCSSLGCNITRYQIYPNNGTIITNPINLIGLGSWDDEEWSNHYFAEIDSVFDACLQVNQDSGIIPANIPEREDEGEYQYYLINFEHTDTCTITPNTVPHIENW